MLLYLISLLVLLVITIALEIIYKTELNYTLKERLKFSGLFFVGYVFLTHGGLMIESGFSMRQNLYGTMIEIVINTMYVIISTMPEVWLSYLVIPYFMVTVIYKTINIFIKK